MVQGSRPRDLLLLVPRGLGLDLLDSVAATCLASPAPSRRLRLSTLRTTLEPHFDTTPLYLHHRALLFLPDTHHLTELEASSSPPPYSCQSNIGRPIVQAGPRSDLTDLINFAAPIFVRHDGVADTVSTLIAQQRRTQSPCRHHLLLSHHGHYKSQVCLVACS